jgi:hypothetical protein
MSVATRIDDGSPNPNNSRRTMSIQHRRPAAGQWTAAYMRDQALQTGGRRKRLRSWFLILPVLAIFAFCLSTGAQAFGSTNYAAALKQLPANKPVIVVALARQPLDNPLGWLSDRYANKEVCSVTASQLASIAAHYQVGHMSVDVNGTAVDMITVDGAGANDHDLRVYLGDANLKCELVRRGGVFFLPFDAHGS